MPIGWFIAPYKRDLSEPTPTRYCAMDDATSLIRADGGDWHESEFLGNRAIVKVRASAATLSAIATAPGIKRLPKNRFDDPLSDLSNAQKRAIRDELLDAGYTFQEFQARFGNDIGNFTLGDIIRFAVTRRRKVRWDGLQFVFDGTIQSCRNALDVHRRCFDDIKYSQLVGLRDQLISEWQISKQPIRLIRRLPNLLQHERDQLLILLGREGYGFDKIREHDTFPSTPILDDFNRADQDLSGNWTVPLRGSSTGTPRIVSNVAREDDTGVNSSAYWNVTTFGDDQEVHGIMAVATDGDDWELHFCAQQVGGSTLDSYTSECDESAGIDRLRTYRVDNDTSTQLGTTDNRAHAGGDSLGGETFGNAVRQYHKTGGTWSLVRSVDDTTYRGGYIGFNIEDTAASLDDFGGGTTVTFSPYIDKANQNAVYRM